MTLRLTPPTPASWLSRAVLSDQFNEVMGDLLEWLARARSAGENTAPSTEATIIVDNDWAAARFTPSSRNLSATS
jgi:hypothetical protein